MKYELLLFSDQYECTMSSAQTLITMMGSAGAELVQLETARDGLGMTDIECLLSLREVEVVKSPPIQSDFRRVESMHTLGN